MKTVILLNTVLAVVYVVVGKAALSLAFLHPSVTAVWPPTGIAVAACILFAYRVWPAVLVGAFVVNQAITRTTVTSAAIAAGNTLEAILGAYLLNRLAGGRKAFWQAEGVLKFVALVAALSTTVCATIGVTSLSLAGYANKVDVGAMWLTWWLGDATGALIITPALILWISPFDPVRQPRQIAETVLVLGVLLLVSQVVFGGLHPFPAADYPLEFLLAPLLAWAAVRLSLRSTAIAILVVSAAALVGTLRGFGPFVRASANESLLLLQAFMGIMAITSFTLAAAVSQRREALADLQRSTERAIAAEERIRAEIAEFLHSRVQNRLLLAWNRLRTCVQLWSQQPEEALDLLTQVSHELDDIREQDVRQASYLLHPSFIREGLVPAVYTLAERFEGQLAVTVEVDPALTAWDTLIRNRLPEALRLAAFRIIEEALGNVVKHAQATTAHISLGLEGHADLHLTVADNGRGFDMDHVRPGLGLASLDSRVRQAGGSWQITSLPGKGTTVAISLPIPANPTAV
jgi:signal transduction histidine kinase